MSMRQYKMQEESYKGKYNEKEGKITLVNPLVKRPTGAASPCQRS
jgi:hypothetical protein